MLLNSVYSCLLFSLAMPVFYFLAFIALITNFLTSKFIFARFSSTPRAFDHKINAFISKSLGLALVIHQIANLWALASEEIFPEARSRPVSKSTRSLLLILFALVIVVVLANCKKLASALFRSAHKKKNVLG